MSDDMFGFGVFCGIVIGTIILGAILSILSLASSLGDGYNEGEKKFCDSLGMEYKPNILGSGECIEFTEKKEKIRYIIELDGKTKFYLRRRG